MSHHNNTRLEELAREHMDYWAGTIWEKIIQDVLHTKDYNYLQSLLKESMKEIAIQEFNPDPYEGVRLGKKDIF